MKTFEQLNIKIPNGAHGTIKAICPACSDTHSHKSRNQKDLSVNITEGIWNCHRCGWKGTLKEKEARVWVRPIKVEVEVGDKMRTWFLEKRKITENTLKFFGVTEKQEWMPQTQQPENCILFPYKRNGEWVNIKFRDGRKNFKMVKDAELIFFNLDAIFGKKRIIICEGEIDCMSLHEVGIYECCSVPNGAAKGNQRLEYLDNCWMAFSDADEILIATDADDAGLALKQELIRRLGRERCKDVSYPAGCKDLNEVLDKHGAKHVFDCVNYATSFPLEGILRLADFEPELDELYNNGFTSGKGVGYYDFDNHLRFSPGELTIITGVPSSGKSAFLDQLLVKFAELHQWPIGACSFENQPYQKHASKLISCFIGRPFYRKDERDKMSKEEYLNGKTFLQENFYWFKIKDEDVSIDGILARGKQLVKRHGIKVLVIDPYNYMEHIRDTNFTETEYISMLLTKICNFAKDNMLHVFLVAHPTKIQKNPNTKDYEVPNLYSISGSAHFFNKTDNGITVHRDRSSNIVTVHIQKVREFYNGKLGCVDFTYDPYCGRYKECVDFSKPEIEKVGQTEYALPEKYNAGFQNYNPNKITEGDKNNNGDDLPF